FGNRNGQRFRKTLRFACLFETGLGACFAVVLFFLSPFMMQRFLDDPEVIRLGVRMLRIMQISSVLVGISLVATCVCEAVGHAAGALVLSLSRQGILFYLAISVLPLLMGFDGILLSQPAADLLTGVLAFVILRNILSKRGI
ncbi:MAG: MATE family efflux transporter, partial [Clostridia bacterium]|nr:MATE family efflux transporter [Clostridia bacterium]